MMGQGLLGFILDRPTQIELVGAIDIDPVKHGRSVGELLGRACDVRITNDAEAVLALKPDVVCVLTASNLDEISEPVEASVTAGCNVIGIAETLAFPWASDPAWARRQGL
jgi:4-hydroxy-tetrahydrodipicolinate reductase